MKCRPSRTVEVAEGKLSRHPFRDPSSFNHRPIPPYPLHSDQQVQLIASNAIYRQLRFASEELSLSLVSFASVSFHHSFSRSNGLDVRIRIHKPVAPLLQHH